MTLMDDNDLRACSDVRNECLQVHPRLMSFQPSSDADPGFTVVTYTAETEAEVDAIYKQMYDEQTTIDDVITMLQAYKNSGIVHEQDIFSCMLHFLFDEYKFFQSYYPARELAMTGYLFGSLIQRQLIEFVPLGIAMRYILDAVECPPETNLFKFGVQALLRFHSRLGEWPAVCQQLAGNTTLMESQPELAASIRRAIANDSDASAAWRTAGAGQGGAANAAGAGGAGVGASAGAGGVGGTGTAGGAGGVLELFTSVHPDLPPGEIESPPEEVSDKIMFIVNNLAPSNFDTKLDEMREQYDDQYARWFAHYLVDTRISTEPNNHGLYLRFLDALARESLDKLILQETYLKSSILLNAEKTMKQATERTILKNIGTWL
jgi:CCR4-NOT transcription complex subunit 1